MNIEFEKKINIISDFLFIIRNHRMSKRIQTDGSITFADVINKIKGMTKYPGLTFDQAKQIKDYYYPYKVSTLTHRQAYGLNGIFDPTLVPDEMYFAYINSYFNDVDKTKVLENKCLFSRIFKDIPQPETVCLRINNILLDPDFQLLDTDRLSGLLNKHEKLFFKIAEESRGGHGVYLLEKKQENDDMLELFNKTIKNINADIIVQKPIIQHKQIAALHPQSVNTMRLITLLEQDGVSLCNCFFRMGRNNMIVDNNGSGGIICGIDENGCLRKYGYSGDERFEKHPDSGVVFKGYQLPSYKEAVEMVKKAHPLIPTSRLVSWDICINEDGTPLMIEANLSQGGTGVQIVNGSFFGKRSREIVDIALKDSDYPKYK